MLLGGRDKRREGQFRYGRILRVYLEGKTPVCDVQDGVGGTFTACRFMALGGGSKAFLFAAPTEPTDPDNETPDDSDGSEVVLLFGSGARGHPVVVGALPNPGTWQRLRDDVEKPDDGDDYSADSDILDIVAENAGARLLLSKHGDLVLDATRSKRPVHVMLPEDGQLRVAQGGDSSERTLLAGPSLDYIDALRDKVNDLGDKLKTLWNAINDGAVYTAMQAGVAAEVASPGTGKAAFSTALKAQAPDLIPPFFYSDQDKPGDDLVASAVRLSSRAKSEE